MNQLQIDFARVPSDRKLTALLFVSTKPERFRDLFEDWLDDNIVIWFGFEREANKMWEQGRKHYSANTIVEYLRHYTLLADVEAEFKVNDKWTSSLARLYACHYPERASMFEFRERRAA